MKWLLREVISKARDLRFLFGRQEFWTWRILNYFDLINRLVSDERTKTKKNWSETRWKWLDFLQWQTWDRISSRVLRFEFKRGPATWPKENSEFAARAYSWATLMAERQKENWNQSFWLEIRFPVAHLGPYGSGRARRARDWCDDRLLPQKGTKLRRSRNGLG